ncbi:MAG: hypothetical protein ABIH00_00915 [Armatimonadota bacterium]
MNGNIDPKNKADSVPNTAPALKKFTDFDNSETKETKLSKDLHTKKQLTDCRATLAWHEHFFFRA